MPLTGSPSVEAIGGYFELNLPAATGEWYPDATKFQSARAAFASLLMQVRPRRIWMPWYNCGTMLEAPALAGVEVRRYSIDSGLNPIEIDGFQPDDCLLYVNYFGIARQQVERVLRSYPPARVIVDHSQAFYATPPDCLATLYSPRKFFALPDGGYLVTKYPITAPAERDDGSFARLEALAIRLAEGPERGYAAIREARASLKGQSPKRMSALTEAMLRRVDYPGALQRRNDNFAMLHGSLGAVNRFPVSDDAPIGPMCYPFLGDRPGLHDWLIRHRVFVGHYWPEARGAHDRPDELEPVLAAQCVPLPCDQRYGRMEMERILALVDEYATGRARA